MQILPQAKTTKMLVSNRNERKKQLSSKLKTLLFALTITNIVSVERAYSGSNTERAGDALQVLTPLAAYSLTFIKGDSEGRKQFYKSFGSTFAATHIIKNALNAERPNGGGQSFPSGHTSAAFQGAGFIHARYGLELAWPAYAAATFVAYSRVAANKHHTRDVIAGAALGAGTSFLFTRERYSPHDAQFQPFMDGTRAGFNVTMPLR